MNCMSCGAALPANSTICDYCKAHNPIDLHGVIEFSAKHRETERPCPNCATPLQWLELATRPVSAVDYCPHCAGLFFPPGGIGFLLDQVVGQVYAVNRALLDNLQRELYRVEKVVYRRCPVCKLRMNRQAFGYRSGVVLDRCSSHGDWLDAGEFLHLAEWKKAGGQLVEKIACNIPKWGF